MAAQSSDMGKESNGRMHYILSLMNERTLERTFHMRLTREGVIAVMGVSIVLLLILFSCFILFTPLRKLLPVNSEEYRQEMVRQTMRVDSLETVIRVQTAYLESLREVLAGEAEADTIASLDSLQMVAREQLLEARSQVTSDFMAEYEARNEIMNIEAQDTIE